MSNHWTQAIGTLLEARTSADSGFQPETNCRHYLDSLPSLLEPMCVVDEAARYCVPAVGHGKIAKSKVDCPLFPGVLEVFETSGEVFDHPRGAHEAVVRPSQVSRAIGHVRDFVDAEPVWIFQLKVTPGRSCFLRHRGIEGEAAAMQRFVFEARLVHIKGAFGKGLAGGASRGEAAA